jgi:Dolichyl-phosphate-mannose-protein mannosyltransferase
MNTLAPRRSYDWVGLAAAIVVGSAALFWNLTRSSPSLDEAFSLHMGSFPLAGLIDNVVHNDAHPPLFYLLTHYLIGWVHLPASQYRLFTAPFGLLTIVATWAVGRRFFGAYGAAVAAMVTAVAPGLLEADRIYRMYSPLAALIALSWWLLIVATDLQTRRRWLPWIGYAACAVALPYLHYLGTLTVAAQSLFALAAIRERWPALAASAAAALAFLPWLWALKVQFAAGGLAAPPGFSSWIAPQGTLLADAPAAWMTQPYFTPVADATIFGVLAAGLILARRTALPYMALGAGLQLTLSIALHKDLLLPRYLDVYAPLFALCVGAAAAALAATKWRVAAVGLTSAIVACMAVCDVNLLFDPLYQRTDWYLVNDHVAANEKPSDVMLFVQGFPTLVVATFPAFAGHDLEAPYKPQVLGHAAAWINTHHDARIWYVENQPWFADPSGELVRGLLKSRTVLSAWHEPRVNAADAVTVILFDAVRRPVRVRR